MLLLWFQRREEIIRLAGASGRERRRREEAAGSRETRRQRREGSQETKIASRNGAIRVEEDIARDTPAQS
jgi:hypothetical protein